VIPATSVARRGGHTGRATFAARAAFAAGAARPGTPTLPLSTIWTT